MSIHRSTRALIGTCALTLTLVLVNVASAASTFFDVQANQPQVAGNPSSNTTAVFPTNKQNEPTIAVNPVNSNYLIAGSNDEQEQPPCGPGPVRGNVPASDCSFFPDVGTSGIYTSNDGGVTWVNRGLLDDQSGWQASPFVSDGDPVIVYGPKPTSNGGFSYANGARAYYASLASYKTGRSPFPPQKAPELLAVSYSDNNGQTWSAPVVAVTKDNPNNFNDKEAIWADNIPSSPFFGRVYVSWTQFRSATFTGNGNEPIVVTVSTNGGTSFSAPNQLSPAGNNGTGNGRQGSAIASGPDGSAYVAWEQGSAQVVAISRNGGASWSRPIAIGPVADIDDPIPGANFRTDSFLSIAADPRAGTTTLYAAWVNKISGVGRVVVSASNDRGQTWSAPATVSTTAEGYAFFQGLDIAPNGRVDVGYQALTTAHPNTFGVGNASIDSWFVSKPVGGSWSAALKVTTASSDPAASAQNNLERQFWGDYNTLVSDATHAWFIYTDSRSGVGCPAVDAYQQALFAAGLTEKNDEDIAEARRQGPAAADPTKPAPPTDCASQFGNTDAFVSVVTP
jgi:hypothetical protein